MNAQKKHLCRIQFQNLIYKADGQKFEDLFVNIMQQKYMDFQPVKPQGSLGDKKNDGYIVDGGIFFQVYGPEDITKSIKDAQSKIKTDFEGLIEQWQTVQEFNFVINDKYKGAYVTVHQEIEKLRLIIQDLDSKKHIKTNLICAKNLENDLLNLEEDEILSIIGFLPSDEKIEEIDLDYVFLNEVIEHILKIPYSENKNPLDIPDFHSKIDFNFISKSQNGYSEAAKELLKYCDNFGDIEIYFLSQGDFVRSQIQNRLTEVYNNSKETIPEEVEDFAEKRYFYMVETCMPENKKTLGTSIAVQSLFAFFFETCDIFENPLNEMNGSN